MFYEIDPIDLWGVHFGSELHSLGLLAPRYRADVALVHAENEVLGPFLGGAPLLLLFQDLFDGGLAFPDDTGQSHMGWQSMVAPLTSNRFSNLGIAVISLLLWSTLYCPRTSSLPLAQVLTRCMAALPSIAMSSPPVTLASSFVQLTKACSNSTGSSLLNRSFQLWGR